MLLIDLHQIVLLMILHEDFRIGTVLHGLIHKKELLQLMLITLLYLLLVLCSIVEVWRPLAYDGLCQIKLLNLLVYYFLHLHL